MTDRARLLAAVLAAPDDDAPRLVFADWLDEHGEAERAEFVRLQCRLVTLPSHDDCIGALQCQRRGPLRPCHEWEKFRWRERELLCRHANGPPWVPDGVKAWIPPNPVELPPGKPEVLIVGFARGFVETATGPAADWLAHADKLLAEHPVTTVRLTTWPEAQTNGELFSKRQRRLAGRERWYWDRHDRQPNWAATGGGIAGIFGGLLKAEWPGVRFALPEPQAIPLENLHLASVDAIVNEDGTVGVSYGFTHNPPAP